MSRRTRADEEFLDDNDDDQSDTGQVLSEEDRSESGGEGYDSDQHLPTSKRPRRGQTVRPITRDKGKGKGKAWEGQFERTWDQVQEDERGTLEGAVSDIMLTSKTRR